MKYFPVTHGGIRQTHHPRLGAEINGQTCIRYLRFMRPVKIDRLELGLITGAETSPMGGSGWWAPRVPTHPAHLIISVPDEKNLRWRTVKQVDLPANPVISDQGLNQNMPTSEMSAILDQARKETRHLIDLDGVSTDLLKVECDREHPTWPSHGECNGGPFNVPFALLNPLQVYGQIDRDDPILPTRLDLLKVKSFRPKAPVGMTVEDLPDMVRYSSSKLSIGFSVRRPMLLHLGWDAFGRDRSGENRLAQNLLFFYRRGNGERRNALSGPVRKTSRADCGSQVWTGEVSVEGAKIHYRNLHGAVDGLRLDLTFTVKADRLRLELTQHAERAILALEYEAWRLAFDIGKDITGAAAMPTLLAGRSGDVNLPMHWAVSGNGSLSCRVIEETGVGARLQVESYRSQHLVTGSAPPGPGVSTTWPAAFACYRPEYAGFADHSASVNCVTNQADNIEVIYLTKKPRFGPEPLDLARFTIGRSLMDGGAYGYCRNLYMDSDPQNLMAAGRVHQVGPDVQWLRQVEPGLMETIDRILETIDEEGLSRNRDLSGNTGSYRWSTNAMDVIGFGHHDTYVNAITYRALRNATAMLKDLGHKEKAKQCRHAADSIHAAFAKTLINPETGSVAGWHSRDGQLHDYAFTWVNGPAIAFGLLDKKAGQRAMMYLEQLRQQQGIGSARLGIPLNLLPINRADHMLPKILDEHRPTFENYTDGSMSGWANYYLRALATVGMAKEAKRLAADLDDAYAYGLFDGGNYTGTEFHSWEGMANGYEGTMANIVFSSLYAIAIEQGVLAPLDPEWWPAGG